MTRKTKGVLSALMCATGLMVVLQANATVVVSNQYLIDDPLFDANFGLPDQATNATINEVWRFTGTAVGIRTAPADAVAGNHDSFTPPVDLFSNGVSQFPYYAGNLTTLDGIYPEFSASDLYMYSYKPEWIGGLQDYQAWYEITLDTTGGIFTATSGSANLWDGTSSNQLANLQMIADAWNTLSWDADPFAGGGVGYDAINSASIQFYYTNVVPNATAWVLSFNVSQAPVKYAATVDVVDAEAPAAPAVVTSELVAANGIKVSWTNSTSADVAYYLVKRSLISGSGYSVVSTNTPYPNQTSFSYSDWGLEEDTHYYIVTATDHAGNESLVSDEVSETTLTVGSGIVSLNFYQNAYPTQLIDSNEVYGISGLGTVVSNWNNTTVGSGGGLLYDNGLASAVSFSGADGENGFNPRFDNTPMKSGLIDYGAGKSVTLNNLNASFPGGYYVIAYLDGWDANTGAGITLGTNTFYFRVDTTFTGADSRTTDTDNTDGYDYATYAVFGSTNAVLTDDSITLTVQKLTGGGAALGGVQVVGVPPIVGYTAWETLYGIEADGPDGDSDQEGTINLLEYALGGNPTNDLDNGYTATGSALDGGTNWFEYIYARSTDANSGLTYTLKTATDLVFTNWITGGYTEMPITGDLGSGYEAVTNRIPTENAAGFVQLWVEQN